jgi:branched-chain amino acid transport system substrate-binding protein
MRGTKLTGTLIAATLIATAVASAPAVQAGDVTDLVIAVEVPLTGPQASNGKDMLRGVRLAARQANAAGGVLGQRIRIVAIDDQADPDLAETSVAAAQKAKAVAVIGPYNSSVGVINLPLYLDAGIVPVHMTSTNDTEGEGVTVQPKNDQISPVEAEYVESTGARTVVMLVDPSTYTQGMADRLRSELTSQGVTVTSIPIVEGQADYSAQVAQALEGVPDLVYVSTYYPEGAAIAQSLATSKLPTRCLMGLANVDPAFVDEAGVVAAQRCAFSGVPEASQMPGARAKAFVAAYRKAFDTKPGVWGIFTYDSARMLFSRMARTGTTGFAPVLASLQEVRDFAGATGSISIDPSTGNRVDVPVYIMRVTDRGVFVVD